MTDAKTYDAANTPISMCQDSEYLVDPLLSTFDMFWYYIATYCYILPHIDFKWKMDDDGMFMDCHILAIVKWILLESLWSTVEMTPAARPSVGALLHHLHGWCLSFEMKLMESTKMKL